MLWRIILIIKNLFNSLKFQFKHTINFLMSDSEEDTTIIPKIYFQLQKWLNIISRTSKNPKGEHFFKVLSELEEPKEYICEDYDYNEIPNTGGEFRQGFFRAHTNTNIYWYLDNHPQYDYWYVDGDTYTVDYKVPDASHTDRNLYAKYNLQVSTEVNDGIGVESYGDGYMGIPSRDENDTAQGGYGKIEK